jgi:hypothetical protein
VSSSGSGRRHHVGGWLCHCLLRQRSSRERGVATGRGTLALGCCLQHRGRERGATTGEGGASRPVHIPPDGTRACVTPRNPKAEIIPRTSKYKPTPSLQKIHTDSQLAPSQSQKWCAAPPGPPLATHLTPFAHPRFSLLNRPTMRMCRRSWSTTARACARYENRVRCDTSPRLPSPATRRAPCSPTSPVAFFPA